jgi:hypothetical protein
MAGKKNKNFGLLISELMEEYNIPTKKDFERLNQRLDELENLLKQAALASMYSGTKTTVSRMPGKKITAADMVLDTVKKEKKPVNFKFMKEKTGFDDKKLRNIIFRLHSTKQIKRVERGCYLPVDLKED